MVKKTLVLRSNIFSASDSYRNIFNDVLVFFLATRWKSHNSYEKSAIRSLA